MSHFHPALKCAIEAEKDDCLINHKGALCVNKMADFPFPDIPGDSSEQDRGIYQA